MISTLFASVLHEVSCRHYIFTYTRRTKLCFTNVATRAFHRHGPYTWFLKILFKNCKKYKKLKVTLTFHIHKSTTLIFSGFNPCGICCDNSNWSLFIATSCLALAIKTCWEILEILIDMIALCVYPRLWKNFLPLYLFEKMFREKMKHVSGKLILGSKYMKFCLTICICTLAIVSIWSVIAIALVFRCMFNSSLSQFFQQEFPYKVFIVHNWI